MSIAITTSNLAIFKAAVDHLDYRFRADQDRLADLNVEAQLCRISSGSRSGRSPGGRSPVEIDADSCYVRIGSELEVPATWGKAEPDPARILHCRWLQPALLD